MLPPIMYKIFLHALYGSETQGGGGVERAGARDAAQGTEQAQRARRAVAHPPGPLDRRPRN